MTPFVAPEWLTNPGQRTRPHQWAKPAGWPDMSLLLIEEFLDSVAVLRVFAVVTSAVDWWQSSRVSDAAIESDPRRAPN